MTIELRFGRNLDFRNLAIARVVETKYFDQMVIWRKGDKPIMRKIEYLFRGQIVYLNKKCPVYNDDDVVIGHTERFDEAVITMRVPDGEDFYLELTIISGQYKGYAGLALYNRDIKNNYLLSKDEYEKELLKSS